MLLPAPLCLQMPLWDELWWDDGLYHSQPVLDGTLTPQMQSPVSATVGNRSSSIAVIRPHSAKLPQ